MDPCPGSPAIVRLTKITGIETFVVDTGFTPHRPWHFRAIRTEDGITGYSEFGSEGVTRGLVGLMQDLGARPIGKDPTAVEKRYIDLSRAVRQASFGATQQARARRPRTRAAGHRGPGRATSPAKKCRRALGSCTVTQSSDSPEAPEIGNRWTERLGCLRIDHQFEPGRATRARRDLHSRASPSARRVHARRSTGASWRIRRRRTG